MIQAYPEPRCHHAVGGVAVGGCEADVRYDLHVGKHSLHNSLSLTPGQFYCIVAAVLYALSIILTDRLSRKEDPLALGIVQVGVMGFLGTIAAFLFETPRLPSCGAEWGIFLVLAIICTGFGFTLQPVAQRYTNSERVGLYCALNPVFAAFLGTVFLHEQLGIRGLVGSVLVLSAVAFSQIRRKNNNPIFLPTDAEKYQRFSRRI